MACEKEAFQALVPQVCRAILHSAQAAHETSGVALFHFCLAIKLSRELEKVSQDCACLFCVWQPRSVAEVSFDMVVCLFLITENQL